MRELLWRNPWVCDHLIITPLPGSCCNTCDEVREAYRLRGWVLNNPEEVEQCKNDALLKALTENAGEGCRVWGKLSVAKLSGNFHIAPGIPSSGANAHCSPPFAL